MLYDFYKVQERIKDEIKNKNIKIKNIGSLFKYLTTQNIVDEGLVSKLYFHNEKPPFFIDEISLSKVENKINEKFEISLNLNEILGKEENNLNDFVRISVEPNIDCKKIINMVLENTVYGVSLIEEKEKNRINVEERLKIQQKEIKQKKNEEYKNKTDIENIDYKRKRILSIDLEFFIKKGRSETENSHAQRRTHDVTEIGLSYYTPEEKYNKSFLIENSRYTEKRRLVPFIFGKQQLINKSNIKPYLTEVIKNVDYILFHEAREDLKALTQLGINIEKDHPNVQIIDTQLIYKKYFGNNMGGKNLDKLLEDFEIEHSKSTLHNGGNDAEYTLRLLFKFQDKFKLENKLEKEDPIRRAFDLLNDEAIKNNMSIVDFISLYSKNDNIIKNEKVISSDKETVVKNDTIVTVKKRRSIN